MHPQNNRLSELQTRYDMYVFTNYCMSRNPQIVTIMSDYNEVVPNEKARPMLKS